MSEVCNFSHFVEAAPFSWVCLATITDCFLQTELHISKREIHVMLKFSSNLSITLEQICVSKTSVRAELALLV